MKIKVSPAVVGAFVIGAFALGVVGILTFGGINFFTKPQRFVVYFDESVHGLDLGSPVKLRGVRVGRVVNLNIRYDRGSSRSVVAVTCEFSKDVMRDRDGTVIDVADRAALQTLVDSGLRGRLNILGLATGLLYIELDFFEPAEYPMDPKLTDPQFAVVPAVPSAIAEFQQSASEILTNLKRVNFGELSRNLTGLMADVRSRLDGLDLPGVAEQWKRTGAEIEALAGGPEVTGILENLDSAVTELRATVSRLDAEVKPAGVAVTDTLADAREAIQAIENTAAVARRFISSHAGLGGEVADSFEHLNEAADAVKRLADFLERNPNALLVGRRPPKE